MIGPYNDRVAIDSRLRRNELLVGFGNGEGLPPGKPLSRFMAGPFTSGDSAPRPAASSTTGSSANG
jgi:hypothetical protein